MVFDSLPTNLRDAALANMGENTHILTLREHVAMGDKVLLRVRCSCKQCRRPRKRRRTGIGRSPSVKGSVIATALFSTADGWVHPDGRAPMGRVCGVDGHGYFGFSPTGGAPPGMVEPTESEADVPPVPKRQRMDAPALARGEPTDVGHVRTANGRPPMAPLDAAPMPNRSASMGGGPGFGFKALEPTESEAAAALINLLAQSA